MYFNKYQLLVFDIEGIVYFGSAFSIDSKINMALE